MKLAFSTLGCPTWGWNDVLSAAKDLGYDGVEIRGIGNELYAPHIPVFLPQNIEKTRAKLASLGLEISMLTSACYLFDRDAQEKNLQIGKDYIDLAAAVASPNVRVMGDATPQPDRQVDLALVKENLAELGRYAKGKNVSVLLESNGVFADTKVLAQLLDDLSLPTLGALWDVHHPFRYCGEQVTYSYDNLKEHLRYIHMKDSLLIEGKTVYKMMGEGDNPNEQVLHLLADSGFDGYVSLEWVKRWNKDLTEGGIVFPRFINYVKTILR